MGLFDFISKIQKKLDDFQKRIETSSFDELFMRKKKKEKTIENEKQNAPVQKQNKLTTKIIKKFYAKYPEIPYISDNRTPDWLKKARLFPEQCIIPQEMMTRFSDGLLPGHVYMLHWLKKYTSKNVPAYFEYKYGVDFEKEKTYLLEHGYLNDRNKPTEKGEEAIANHADVIERHSAPKVNPKRSIEYISSQIIAQRDSLLRNGFKRYEFIANSDCCSVCGELNGKHFSLQKLEIGVNAPPMHEGCSCSIAAWSDRREYEEWLNFISKGGTTDEYNNKKR